MYRWIFSVLLARLMRLVFVVVFCFLFDFGFCCLVWAMCSTILVSGLGCLRLCCSFLLVGWIFLVCRFSDFGSSIWFRWVMFWFTVLGVLVRLWCFGWWLL